MIDSHAHLYAEDFDADRPDVMQRLTQAGITHVVMPNENLASLHRQKQVCNQFPHLVSMTIGLHPEEVADNDWREQLDTMEQLLTQDSTAYVAIGEIGMDLYWDKTYCNEQMQALHTQLQWCQRWNLPFIIHCREALNPLLEVLSDFRTAMPRGVLHSFTGTETDVQRIRTVGDFYFGINGIVTFKKSTVHQALAEIGLGRILLETDSPYLAPVPHRGRRNESAYLPHVAQCIAQHLNLSPNAVDRATTSNARTLFRLH